MGYYDGDVVFDIGYFLVEDCVGCFLDVSVGLMLCFVVNFGVVCGFGNFGVGYCVFGCVCVFVGLYWVGNGGVG